MITNNKTSLSDIPFKEEVNDFGTERYVDGLIKFIENSAAPITIALQGEWGSGKTSLMTRLERALCGNAKSQFVGVEINTWEYSMMSSPEMTVYKILTQLVQKLTNDDPQTKSELKKLLRGTGRLLYRGAREGVKHIPVVGDGVSILMEAVNLPTQILENTDENESVSLSDLKNTLEQAVQKIISEKNKRGVIVFVDDLDRLNPPVAVEILELLKNIFCINNCIFVLAIDYEVVVKGLEPKFGKMTDKNEREFRSFFDKIIQVPFSLPVNSYRPMDFVLDSLVKIGYITAVEKGDERFRRPFREIVEWSVGKNPRSIKRLVNTLSLLSCIAQSGQEQDSKFTDSREGRIVTFAIVAIQVCYSKIYRMLALMPNFMKWDNTLAARLNIQTEHKEKEQEQDWEEILEAVCQSDQYLSQHFNDIRFLLFLIKDTLKDYEIVEKDVFEEKIRSVIDKSSVTGISEPSAETEIDQKRLIAHLHENVYKRILQKRPDIQQIKCKNNTGNGGFFLPLPDGKEKVEIIIRPRIAPGTISCELLLSTQIRRPDKMIGKSWDDMLMNETVNAALSSFDHAISPLLQNLYYFEGHTYPETKMGTYFKSFTAEQAYRCGQGWHPDHICQNVSYWIKLSKEILFEDRAVVGTIADVVIATYDLRKATMNL